MRSSGGIDVEEATLSAVRVRGPNTGGEAFLCAQCAARQFSNANLRSTIEHMVGEDYFFCGFYGEARAVRNNTSSCRLYMGIRKGETIPNIGDLVFTSKLLSTALRN